ncbi:MAG: hypothetical protein KIT09_14730, partial [Bryobacteraceae bacterium]|nr:hypothetical protein [Bryobacteraceae bacterium]
QEEKPMKWIRSLAMLAVAAGLVSATEGKPGRIDGSRQQVRPVPSQKAKPAKPVKPSAEAKAQEIKAAAGSKAKAEALTLPKEAVAAGENTWRHKDSDGKVWIYRRTPFGLVRYEDNNDAAAPAPKPAAESTGLRAFDDGDSIRFERPGPFGNWRWTRKKTEELNDEERQAWQRARKSATPAGSGAAEDAARE